MTITKTRVLVKSILVAGLAALAVALAVACSGPVAGTGEGRQEASDSTFGVLPVEEAALVVREHLDDDDFVLLDIRTPIETAGGHLPGAQFLDFYDSAFRSELQKLDRTDTYLIYCRTGNRTGQAYALMTNLGFERVYDMGGGITEWIQRGYPICQETVDGYQLCYGTWPDAEDGT